MAASSSNDTAPTDEQEPRPIPQNALPCDSENISHVELFRPKTITNTVNTANASTANASTANKKKRRPPLKRYHLLFLSLYLHQAYWIYTTIGQPYAQFLDKAEREGFEVMEGSAKMRAELAHALSDLDDTDRITKKVGWFDWMEMDIEEHHERKKREKEATVLDSLPKSMRVPKRHAASFASCLCSGILLTLHLLVVLLQVWSVRFNVWMNFVGVDGNHVEVPEEWMELEEDGNPLLQPIPKMEATKTNSESTKPADNGNDLMERIEYNNTTLPLPNHLPTHAVITPTKRTESPILVPLLYMPTLGITMEYHRRRYHLSDDGTNREWTKVRCNTEMPLGFFARWAGISSAEQTSAASIRFGKNLFEVRQPTFLKMYKAQLLSPFTVFQLFCVVLWMLDDYWQYSAFTLFMILTDRKSVV